MDVRKNPSVPPIRLGEEFDAVFDLSPDFPITGSNVSDTVPALEFSVVDRDSPNFAPISIEHLELGMKKRPNTSQSVRCSFQPKTYLFGFAEEMPYIPHPSIASLKPKTVRTRSSTSSIKKRKVKKREAPVRLSARRKVEAREPKRAISFIDLGDLDL